MKEKLKIIGAIVVMLTGIGILIGALTFFPSPRIVILIEKDSGNVYSYNIDPNYEPTLRQMLVFLVLGCLLLGFGLGVLAIFPLRLGDDLVKVYTTYVILIYLSNNVTH